MSPANSPLTGENITTILQRDVRDLARVDALHTLPNLLKLLAARASGLLNLADVGRDAGLPHTTLTRYLALLETVFLVHRLPAWSRNLGKRLVKAPKLHLVDSGLACHLVGADARRLSAKGNWVGLPPCVCPGQVGVRDVKGENDADVT